MAPHRPRSLLIFLSHYVQQGQHASHSVGPDGSVKRADAEQADQKEREPSSP